MEWSRVSKARDKSRKTDRWNLLLSNLWITSSINSTLIVQWNDIFETHIALDTVVCFELNSRRIECKLLFQKLLIKQEGLK